MKLRNARFWMSWLGGEVKLTVHPGQTINLHEAHQTDEGFSSETITYEYDVETGLVTCEVYQRSRDCDGLYEWEGQSYYDPVTQMWERGKSRQRDHSAEAAGY